MDKVICFISYLVFVLTTNQAQAQEDSHLGARFHDTLSLGEYSLVIDVPQISLNHKSAHQYEEGFLITYPYIDSAYLFIHKGYNIKRPFCDTTQIKLVSEDKNLKCYYGVINDSYTKEVFYKTSKITISYVNVKEKYLSLFDGIISSLEFIPCCDKDRNTKRMPPKMDEATEMEVEKWDKGKKSRKRSTSKTPISQNGGTTLSSNRQKRIKETQ